MCFAVWRKLGVAESANKQLNKTLRKLGGGDSSSSDSEMISMQGSSLSAVSLPLGSAWQQQQPHLILYLSDVLHPLPLAASQVRFTEKIVSCSRVCCHVPSVPPSGFVGWCAGWLASAGLCQALQGFGGWGGGLTSPGLMTHEHSRIFSWPPRPAAPQ